ncbi:MAG: sigma-70 family RNA polymerase sigma factor [Verrucomicrobiae bacterium]|nr:sigma-70 family RNA polymerase sigma factor [Verrucomicrobiae bacterium]
MSEAEHQPAAPPTNQRFATTHWTVVLTAKGMASPDAAEALEHLCRAYWPALYAYVRREGHAPADAADLTQAFFARFLEKQFLQDVDRAKGKFRSFLLKTLNHFLADEWRHAHAQKRAGSHPALSINAEEWESRFGQELVSELTPEKLFERRWALALFDQALARLRAESGQAGKGVQFDLLKEFLSSGADEGAYARVAGQLGISPGAVAVQVHRLRKRYGELVREEVSHTVSEPGEVEEELRHLLGVLSG